MEGIEDAGGVLELVINGLLISLEGIQRRDSRPRTEVFAALGQPVLAYGTRLARDQVHSSGPWDDPSREWSTMPVSSRGSRRRRSWWCHTCSSTPNTRTPAKRAGSSDAACRHGLIWDHTVFHVVSSCRANPAMVAPSKPNCQITQRIARTPKRARGLVRSPHTQGTQPAGCMTQHRAPEPLGCELHSSDGSPPNRPADRTDHNDQATQRSR